MGTATQSSRLHLAGGGDPDFLFCVYLSGGTLLTWQDALFCISRKRIPILSCAPQAEAGGDPRIWGAGANSTDPTGA